MPKRELWELSDYACPIVGTCLTCAELRKMAGRVGLEISDNATDFELHGAFVSLSRQCARPARQVQKHLDRKFRRQIRRFARARGDEAVWSLWTELADAGDIPGAFWAVMRVSDASTGLLAQVYGEVHMLSHLVGASTRADLRRLSEVESRTQRLEAALAERKLVLRQAVAVWKRRCMELERDLAGERARRERAEHERVSLRELVESRSLVEMERDRAVLAGQLERMQDRAVEAEAQSRRQAAIIEDSYREESTLRAALAEREREVAALELAAMAGLRPQTPCGGACDDPLACPCPHLRGKCVLYVGGRSGLKSEYRLLGQRFGCELLHHDGGLEQSPQRLRQMLARADAVVCPVDCVSHDACARVKRLCRGAMKPVLFARSSGLSSLAASLTELDRSCQ